jgi:hypothetical protein
MTSSQDNGRADGPSNAEYERALEIAQTCLDQATDQAGDLDFLVSVMMIEAAVNMAVDLTCEEDVLRLLKDLVQQIEQSVEAG